MLDRFLFVVLKTAYTGLLACLSNEAEHFRTKRDRPIELEHLAYNTTVFYDRRAATNELQFWLIWRRSAEV